MKNLYSKNDFLNLRNEEQKLNEQLINEGLFNFLGNMFNKAKTYIKKINGAQKIEDIYNKYIKLIEDEFKRKAQVDLSLTSEKQLNNLKAKDGGNQTTTTETTTVAPKKTTEATTVAPSAVKTSESVKVHIKNRLNEDTAEANVVKATEQPKPDNTAKQEGKNNIKMTVDALKKKQTVLQNILTSLQNKAMNEMERVITSMGGREKNPKLAIVADNKKEEFKLAFLNAEISLYEKGGDKVSATKLAAERNKLAKDLNNKWNNLDKAQHVEIDVDGKKLKVGMPYRYKRDDGTIKTIKITNKSQEPGKIKAYYTFGDSANQEQDFRAENVDTAFKPEVGKEYNYYSVEGGKEVKVKIDSYDENKQLAEVHIGEDGNKFKVYAGALMNLPKEAPAVQGEVAPAANTATKKVKSAKTGVKPAATV
jgi:hypothetical protein